MKIALAALVAVSLAMPRQDEPKPTVEDLLAADRAFCAATTERGLDGWMQWFADDAIVVKNDGASLTGRAEMRAHYESLAFPPAGFAWEPDAGGLAASGDVGWTAGAWEMRPPGAQEAVAGGRYLSVWSRAEDGEWRAVCDLGGEPAYRTRIAGLDGPPSACSSTSDAARTSKDGALAWSLESWEARGAEATVSGRALRVWTRAQDGAWELASEIGAAY